MKKLKRDKQRGLLKGLNDQDSQADNFELFMGQTDITWCYYKDSHRALGQTYGVVVLQDFEALTPNIMARTVETCAGGGYRGVRRKSLVAVACAEQLVVPNWLL